MDGIVSVWTVSYVDEAREERAAMPPRDRVALDHAVDKLAAFGPQLPFPHQSDVRDGKGLRELRPRAGRSAWRALYQRHLDVFYIAAVGPEAAVDPRGFHRAVASAIRRMEEVTR